MRRNLFYLYIVLLLEVYQVLSHGQELLNEESIDAIIDKHWNQHTNRLGDRRRNALDSNVITNDWNYKCQHDQVMQDSPVFSEEFHKRIRSEQISQPKISQKRQSGIDTMRFVVDSTPLSSADLQTCSYIGQMIPFGSPPNTATLCVSDGQSNCYYLCQSYDILSTSLIDLINNDVMPTVLDVFSSFLKVENVDGNLLLDQIVWSAYGQECYDGVNIPSSYVDGFGTGIPDADMVVFVGSRPSPSSGTVAYALACNFEYISSTQFGRPLAGFINFSPRYFQKFVSGTYTQFDFKSAVKVGIHELTHALGFSSFFYKSYIDSNTGLPYVKASETFARSGTSPASQPYNVNIARIVTPKVIETVANHYQCAPSSTFGMDLEDFGGAGTAGSHWELRTVYNEYMAGYINPLMPVSYLTMSLFEDMGWYQVDYSKAEFWGWGKDQGCTFLNGRCESWPLGYPNGYRCSSSFNSGCSADRQAYGNCNLVAYTGNLPAYYQHFSNPTYGGTNSAADYCTFTNFNVFCANTSAPAKTGVFEEFSSTSICFEVGQGASSITDTSNPVTSCYKYSCDSNNQLSVIINGNSYLCPPLGGVVSVPSLNGVVNCPTSSLICRPLGTNVAITTKPLTSGPLTSSVMTTQPLTTQPLTTKAMTTKPMTTVKALSTKPLTTQKLTTQRLTTQPRTSRALTTKPLTTRKLTTRRA